jgi:hypothetical protein
MEGRQKMSYEVIIKKTGQMYKISDEEGFDLKAKRAEAKRPFLVELEDDQYYSNEIAAIRRQKITQADIPNFEQATLPSGPKCNAQYSIQREINQIAQDLSGQVSPDNPDGLKWSKLVTDKTWRESMRQQLHDQPGGKWCDAKAAECACE